VDLNQPEKCFGQDIPSCPKTYNLRTPDPNFTVETGVTWKNTRLPYELVLKGYKETLEERARFRREKQYFKWKRDGPLDDGNSYFTTNLSPNRNDYPYGDKRLIN